MRLTTAYIKNYKRFGDHEHKLELSGEVIALIGPNEAGKSSVLGALTELNHRDEFGPRVMTRNSTGGTSVRLHYILEGSDRAAISGIQGFDQVRRMSIEKRDGGFYYTLYSNPDRDLSTRHDLHERLKRAAETQELDRFQGLGKSNAFSIDLIAPAVKALSSTSDDLSSTQLKAITDFARRLENSLKAARAKDQFVLVSEDVDDLISELKAYEEGPSPGQQIANVLITRRPQCRFFDESSRSLSNAFDLSDPEILEQPGLSNLLSLAKLDPKRLVRAMEQEEVGIVEHLLEVANEELKAVFRESWSEQDVYVRLRLDGTILSILVSLPHRSGYTDLKDRSDGLMWFVALRAFLAVEDASVEDDASKPVLLVDEAETHLHYDAQAELIRVFSTQDLAQKVIYTTHSVGCLPQDLGTGIRVIEKDEALAERSRIRNSPWESNVSGTQPIVVGLGATAFSFLPARNVVICEGVTDAMLYPTLFREASGESRLDFQVVPGLSKIEPRGMAALIADAGNVLFLLDGDPEGRELRKKLIAAGVSKDSIILLDERTSTPLTLEDLIAPSAFASAVERIYRQYHNLSVGLSVSEVRGRPRWNRLKEWWERGDLPAIDKRPVAQSLLDHVSKMALDGDSSHILDGKWRRKVKSILDSINVELSKTSGHTR